MFFAQDTSQRTTPLPIRSLLPEASQCRRFLLAGRGLYYEPSQSVLRVDISDKRDVRYRIIISGLYMMEEGYRPTYYIAHRISSDTAPLSPASNVNFTA